jgi:integrase/recombinase XerD
MSVILPIAAWPKADSDMWERLIRRGGPLDDCGALSHLRPTSLATLEVRYSRWLGWLASTEPSSLLEPPADRATMTRLLAWLDALGHVAPMSKLIFVGTTLRVLRAAAPERNWGHHRQLEASLRLAAGRGNPARKRGRVLSSAVLLEAGVKLASLQADIAKTEFSSAKRRRDGTMVGMLALMPMRRRAFAGLRLGHSLHITQNEILVALSGEMTKNGLPWEAPVPSQVTHLLRRYLSETRPWFMARGGQHHDYLWVDDRGAPYFNLNRFGKKITAITTEITGARVPPHFFRDAAATTLARMSPEAARLIRPLLAHSRLETAERHYIQAGSVEAGRDYAAVIKRMKRE